MVGNVGGKGFYVIIVPLNIVHLLISMKSNKYLTVRLPEIELAILQQYCDQTDRSQTDVIRSYIRSLKKKLSVTAASKDND